MQVALIKCIIINFTFFINLAEVNGLIELTSDNDDVIITTEAAIRDTINKVFHVFKLKGINNKPKFKQYSMVHNSLVAIMLRDNENLKTISKLVRVDNNIDNTTHNFMRIINELLDAEENSRNVNENNENVMDDYVIKYIDNFLSELKSLKEKFGVVNTLNINDELAKVLTEDDNSNINVKLQNNSNSTESNHFFSEDDFWQPSGRRIYQGNRAKIRNFPFMASIQIFEKFQCSGSIIKSDLIITAASCLQLAWNNRFFRENPAFLSVRVGSSFHNGGGEIIPVLEVYFHPNYNPKNLQNNLCILRLIRHLKMRSKVRKIKKIRFDVNPWSLPVNTHGITVLGWGAKRANNIIYDNLQSQLAFAVLDVYPLTECREVYSREYVSRNNFCAGFFSKGGGACNRDVGGPGVVNGVLTGVISFGSPTCGVPDAPTVFTKLGYYVDWIEDILEQDVPHTKKRTTLQHITRFTLGPHTRAPTTFVVQPLTENKPTPPQEIDIENIELMKDEDLFQQFLVTMFGRKKDFNETANETKEEIKPHKKEQTKHEPWVTFVTKIFNFDTDVTENYPERGYTVLEPNLSDIVDTDAERDVARLIDNTDVNDYEETDGLEASTAKTSMLENIELDSYERIPKDYSKVESEESDLKDFESVVYSKPKLFKDSKGTGKKSASKATTLVYLSNNNKNNKNDQIDDDDLGISIETDPFQDATFRQDIQKILNNFLPKDLYELLEAVDNSRENKIN